jgi:thioredoxin reductase (NADPH)
VTWTNQETGKSETRDIGNVFVMIGAEPNTDWLGGCVRSIAAGFVITGPRRGGPGARLTLCDRKAGHLRGRRRAVRIDQEGGLGRRRGSVVVSAVHAFLADLDRIA